MGRAEQEKKMIKWEDFKKACEYLESHPSLYSNEFPKNCLRFDGVYKTADCWNYVKSLIWSDLEAAYDRTGGKYWYEPGKYGLGDWTGAQILAKCSNRSTDMKNIRPGEFMYLVYNGGSHAGIYMGEINGKRKVCEFTPLWENGCHFSDIADDGTRSYMGVKYARWQEHGMLPWIEYPEEEVVITEPTEDITEAEASGDADENIGVWKKVLIDIMFAISKAIDSVFKKGDE